MKNTGRFGCSWNQPGCTLKEEWILALNDPAFYMAIAAILLFIGVTA